MSHTATQRPDVAAGETRNAAIDFSGKLDSGELLTGTPTVVDNNPESPEELTIGSVSVNTVALTIDGQSVAIGEAVQWSASGFVSGKSYTFKITATTDATPAQVLIAYAVVDVE